MWRGIGAAFSGTPGNWNPLSSSLIPLFPPVCYVRWRLRSTWPYAGIQLLPPPSVRHGVRRRPRSRSDLAAIWYTPAMRARLLYYYVSLLRNSYLIFRPSMQDHHPLSMLTVRKAVWASYIEDKRHPYGPSVCGNGFLLTRSHHRKLPTGKNRPAQRGYNHYLSMERKYFIL